MKKSRFRLRSAFSLVEVTLALGICSFCLISLVGLLPAGIGAINNSSREAKATSIATALLADLQASATTTVDSTTGVTTVTLPASSHLYAFPCSANVNTWNFIPMSSAQESWTTTNDNGQFRVVVTKSQQNTASPIGFTVKVSWPGVANAVTQGSVTVFGRSH